MLTKTSTTDQMRQSSRRNPGYCKHQSNSQMCFSSLMGITLSLVLSRGNKVTQYNVAGDLLLTRSRMNNMLHLFPGIVVKMN